MDKSIIEKAKTDIDIARHNFEDLKDDFNAASHAVQLNVINLRSDLKAISRALEKAIDSDKATQQ